MRTCLASHILYIVPRSLNCCLQYLHHCNRGPGCYRNVKDNRLRETFRSHYLEMNQILFLQNHIFAVTFLAVKAVLLISFYLVILFLPSRFHFLHNINSCYIFEEKTAVVIDDINMPVIMELL